MNNLLVKSLPIYAPNVNPEDVFHLGPYDLPSFFDGDDLRGIRQSFLVGLRGAWAMGIALFGMAFLAAFLAKWPGKIEPHSDTEWNQKSTGTNGNSNSNSEKGVVASE